MSRERTPPSSPLNEIIQQAFMDPTALASLSGAKDASIPKMDLLTRFEKKIKELPQPDVDGLAKFLLTGMVLEDEFWTDQRREAAFNLFGKIEHIRLSDLSGLMIETVGRIGLNRRAIAEAVLKTVGTVAGCLSYPDFATIMKRVKALLFLYPEDEDLVLQQIANEIVPPGLGDRAQKKQIYESTKRIRERRQSLRPWIDEQQEGNASPQLTIEVNTEEELEEAVIDMRSNKATIQEMSRTLGEKVSRIEDVVTKLLSEGRLERKSQGRKKSDQ